ncbi:5'-methylthioadenosine/S-adenosylhomocysteine nucleosidase family protein [Rhodococcoides fascians]|uniref:5'-methylthioadenosine/S-adenosylhomocysteine nucleosidase family protein n=1 Tax=Rhodococcoides fascians TaxID=1828 RepID=UPI0012D2B231|nr:hypothetical protein [Rhodococcus fascians]
MTIIDDEMSAVLDAFGATLEIEGTGCWTEPLTPGSEGKTYPFVVSQCTDRSNMPSLESTSELVEDWRPEYVILVGIAGAIARIDTAGALTGLVPGDVVCIDYVHYGEYVKIDQGEKYRRYYAVAHPSTELMSRIVLPLARTPWSEDLETKKPNGDVEPPAVQRGEVIALEFLAGDASAEEQRTVFGQYDHALAVDMESAGVARAMHTASKSVHYRPSWIGIRGISDRTAATLDAQTALNSDNDAERTLWRAYAAGTAAHFARKVVERLLKKPRMPHGADSGAPGWFPK